MDGLSRPFPERRQFLPERLERAHLPVQRGDLGVKQAEHTSTRQLSFAPQLENRSDLTEGQTDQLRFRDEAQTLDVSVRIHAVTSIGSLWDWE